MHSIRIVAILSVALGITGSASRAEDRSIDGTGNSQFASTRGAANTPFIRFGYRANFFGPDGEMPNESQRPNARDISNAIFAQTAGRPSSRNLSNYIWAWGQFLTHDMDLSTTSAGPAVNGTAPILVNSPTDPLGPNSISFTRANFVASGLQARTPINEVTSYIDASNVYGSDAVRAAALRTNGGSGAKLLTSANDLLPHNTAGMPNENHGPFPDDRLFLAGDVRANENSLLTAVHTVFVREHNRLVDRIATQQPELNDEQQYQLARKIVGAEVQAITYGEFLPALLGTGASVPKAPQYVYQPQLDASITTAFSHAAFRFGHSAVTSQLELRDADDNLTGSLALRDVFYNPDLIASAPSTIDKLLSGAAGQRSEEIDTLMVDDLRDFLFGPPGAGGLDLASLNIQRGRDAGLPTTSSLFRAYQATPVSSFDQLTSDFDLAQKLTDFYGTAFDTEAWVAGLAQDHEPGASVGNLFKSIIQHQFRRLRDGDRLFYRANAAGLYTDGVLNAEIAAIIDLDNWRLSDLLAANTSITSFQQNVFFVPGTGDFNGDGAVDAADYTVWRDSLGQTGAGLAADADDNQIVDVEDFNLWKQLFGSQYGPHLGSGSIASVPEPSSIVLVSMLGLAFLPPRRRFTFP